MVLAEYYYNEYFLIEILEAMGPEYFKELEQEPSKEILLSFPFARIG